MINNYMIRFGEMWKKSRTDCGKSQEYMAKQLEVSKRTVQNWEDGISCPSQEKGFEWFAVLNIPPLPYYLDLLYPSYSNNDSCIDQELVELVSALPIDAKKKLLYCIVGKHGSSPLAILELVTAHLQTPLRNRLNIAEIILTNYSVAHSLGELRNPDNIQPNMEILEHSLEMALKAVKERKKAYNNMGDD